VMTWAGLATDAYGLPARATRLVLGHEQTASRSWAVRLQAWQRARCLRRELPLLDVLLANECEALLEAACSGWRGQRALLRGAFYTPNPVFSSD
jgi:hypothetical protein